MAGDVDEHAATLHPGGVYQVILDLVDSGIRFALEKAPSSVIVVTGAVVGVSEGTVQLVSVKGDVLLKPHQAKKERLGTSTIHVKHFRIAPQDFKAKNRWEFIAKSIVWAEAPILSERLVSVVLEREKATGGWELAIQPHGTLEWVCMNLPDFDPRVQPGTSNAWRYVIGEDAF